MPELVRNRCASCDAVIEAPAGSRRAVTCAACGAANVLQGLDEPGLSGATTALEAAERLRDVSVYLLGFAYLILAVALLLGTVLAVGTGLEPAWKAAGFLGSSLLGVFLFVYLKFTSDAVRTLADLTELGRSIEGRLTALLEREGVPTGGLAPEVLDLGPEAG